MNDRTEYWVEVAGEDTLIHAKSAREAAEFECAKNIHASGTSMAIRLRGKDDEAATCEDGEAETYFVAQDAVSQEWHVMRADEYLLHRKLELQKFAAEHGLCETWHEPNEQVSVRVIGQFSDDGDQGHSPAYYDQEIVVHLFVDSDYKLSINLATLLAIAAA